MPVLLRLSRLRQPRSTRASTALLLLTFTIFAVMGHLAITEKQSSGTTVTETPSTLETQKHWTRLQALR